MAKSGVIAKRLSSGFIDLGYGGSIATWAKAFLSQLSEIYPDEEVYLIGTSRLPRHHSFLLGSTVGISDGNPIRVQMTPKSAEAFLTSVDPGLRILSDELPYSVGYDVMQADDTHKRFEITFYDAICFDTRDHSLILAFVLNDGELREIFGDEDLEAIESILRNQAMPLFENLQLRQGLLQQTEESKLLLQMLGDGHPGIAALQQPTPALIPQRSEQPPAADPVFFKYAVRELRQPLQGLEQSIRKQFFSSANGSGLIPREVLEECDITVRELLSSLRSLSNISALSLPEARLNPQPMPVKMLLPKIMEVLRPVCERANIRLILEENTRNVYTTLDLDNFLKCIERLAIQMAPFARHGTMWLRSEDSDTTLPVGMMMFCLEDSGSIEESVNPAIFLSRPHLLQLDHPRLARGGGMLLQATSVFMEKINGRFRLARSSRGGFSAQMILPLASRASLVEKQYSTGFDK